MPRSKHSSGYWNITDPQHPDYVELFGQAEPEEEIIAGGTHHIITLQGSQPLSPVAPILPQIVETAEAGHSIPTDITPVAAMSQINTTNTTGSLVPSSPLMSSIPEEDSEETLLPSSMAIGRKAKAFY